MRMRMRMWMRRRRRKGDGPRGGVDEEGAERERMGDGESVGEEE
jgi:hypothetical protein